MPRMAGDESDEDDHIEPYGRDDEDGDPHSRGRFSKGDDYEGVDGDDEGGHCARGFSEGLEGSLDGAVRAAEDCTTLDPADDEG